MPDNDQRDARLSIIDPDLDWIDEYEPDPVEIERAEKDWERWYAEEVLA